MPLSLIKQCVCLWENPIDDSLPCGEDVSFSPDFEALRLEVEKNTSLHAEGATDWDLVLRLATDILEKQGKDLWVLCYGVRSAYAISGLAGCGTALSIFNTLLEKHWDSLYPPASRLQRRSAPLQWLAGRLEQLLPADAFPAERVDTLAHFKTEIEKLQNLLDEKFGDTAPSFSVIRRAIPDISSREKSSTAEVNVPPPVLKPVAELLTAIDGDGRVPDAILPQLLRATQEQAQQLAVHYLSLDVTDWRVYLLHRAALWSTINQLPQANASGVTQLRPLPRDRALTYTSAVDSKQFAAALPQLERSAGKAPFWLDGHYLVVRCLEGLEAHAAKNILVSVLSQFIKRFPELVTYKYHDGTPFASPKTLQWLEGLQQQTFSGGAPGTPWGGTANADAPEDGGGEEALLHEALMLKEQKDFQAGLALLGSMHSGRSRTAIRHGLLKARYCMAAGRPKAAAHLLQALYTQLEDWELLDWEPELSAQILSLLLSTRKGQGTAESNSMIRRLHWLHLDTALGTIKES